MHAVASGDETDELFERWRAMRARRGDHVDLHDLYDLVAEAHGVVPDDLDLEERRELAARALEVIWPGFEQVAPVRSGGRVEVVDYDASWPARFAALRDRLAATLGAVAQRIDHIGSTSVPGLDAKPIIDVQVSVADLADEAAYAPGCSAVGFELYSRDDVHRFFSVPSPAPRDAQVHVCGTGGAFEHDHLLFRDYLRAHDDERDAYAAMKRDAAARWTDDRMGYTFAKSDHILDLLARARDWAEATAWPVGHGDEGGAEP
jgi:GrpB-like predicted nucleotidyltransferase (UPF0157 family)